MARITPQQRQRYGPFLTGSVPGNVLKAIDDRELGDRLAQASGLMQQAAKTTAPGAGRQLGEQAQRILSARPRAQTEQIVVAKIAKAKALGGVSNPQAAYLERQAREELLQHPPAVRRFDPAAVIRKAKADAAMLACFDQAGKLYGVCDPDDIELVDGGDSGQPPTGQATPGVNPAAQVTKSGKPGKQMRAVFDQQHRLIGMVDPENVTEVITDVPGAKEAIGKAHARFVAKAQRARVSKTVPAGHVAVYDQAGKLTGYVRPEDIAAPAAQASSTGPVNAGGTTGLGLPRNAPQQARPSDPPDRKVVKAAQRAPARPATGRVLLVRDLPPRNARRAG